MVTPVSLWGHLCHRGDGRVSVVTVVSPLQGCSGSFTSIMGYLYHMKKCGKEESELEKLLLNCSHCGKAYKSKAGLEYHLKSEHAPVSPAPHCTPHSFTAEHTSISQL